MLCVTALGDSTRLAQQRAYEVLRGISLSTARSTAATSGSGHTLSHAHSSLPRGGVPWAAQRDDVARASATTSSACRSASSRRWRPRAATPFLRDAWQREPGGKLEGDGISRLVEGGALLERGGCGFSHVHGPGAAAVGDAAPRRELAGAPFEAMGVSLVFHPRNPYVPTVHMNVRMLAAMPAGRRAGGLVRRRHGPHALLRLRGGRAPLPPRQPRRAGAVRRRQVPALQALVRRVLLPQAPRRAARHRRHLLRRLRRGRLRRQLRPDARGRRRLPAGLPADRAAPPRARPTASASATSRPTGAAATSSSTWSATAARCSACSRAGAPRAS